MHELQVGGFVNAEGGVQQQRWEEENRGHFVVPAQTQNVAGVVNVLGMRMCMEMEIRTIKEWAM